MKLNPTFVAVHIIALAAFAALALAVSHPRTAPDGARCTTDSDCAARFGGDGGPAPLVR